MNLEIIIFPGKQFPIYITWGFIKIEYKRLIAKLDIDPKEYGSFENLYIRDGRRELVTNFDSIPIIYPERISFEVSKANDDDECYRNYLSLRYFHSWILEFRGSWKWVYWYLYIDMINFGVDSGDIKWWIVPKPLNKSDLEKFEKSLDELKFYLELDTDIEDEGIDPIFVLAIIFCDLVDGKIFIKKIKDEYFLSEGFYSSSELASLIGLDME